MHLDIQAVIAAGVGIHLLTALAKVLFKTPQQQDQISAIEAKVDDILGQLKEVLK